MLVTGFLSGVHCLGMCGGIVAAFSGASARATVAAPSRRDPFWREAARQLAFNTGRIASYSFAGAIAGALGGAGAYLSGALSWQVALYVLANVMLVLVGLYLAGASAWLGRVEAILVWGWLPCGLVYAALAAAVLAGSPERGALAMAAFGLGTLPNLLAAGLAAARLRAFAARRAVRLAAGGVVLGFGVVGLVNAGAVAEAIRSGVLCF